MTMMRPKDLLYDWAWQHLRSERLPPTAERLWTFLEFLQEKARHFNLTAITDMGEMVTRHAIDSLAPFCAAECPLATAEPLRAIDIGSGNGFPGLALAVAFPHWRVALLESSRKKAEFLRSAATHVGADNVVVLNERAEAAGRDPQWRDSCDLAVARALAILPVAVELCMPLVRPDGWFLAYKGADCRKEIDASGDAFEALRGRIDRETTYGVAQTPLVRLAVWARKTAPTPEAFPRRDGLPKKRPLWKGGPAEE